MRTAISSPRTFRPGSPRGRRHDRARTIGRRVAIHTSQPVEFIDITEALSSAAEEEAVVNGLLVAHTRHTTTGLMINEGEPMLLDDLKALFERLVPAAAYYAHDDYARRTANLMPGERRNGHAHCRAALLRTSECVPVAGGRLSLGRWQRVFFVEFDGGQRREVSITFLTA